MKNIVEILNDNFCKVFTTETAFRWDEEEEERANPVNEMQSIVVTKGDMENIITKLDANKSMGPDGVHGKVLKECNEQLMDPILDIIKSSIESGQVPREWKRANIVPI